MILEVAETYQETADSRLITFNVPKELQTAFRYQAGQYVTLEAEIEGKVYKRPYSLCGSIDQPNALSILVKRVPGGKVSNFLNDAVQVGQQFSLSSPQGDFVTDSGWLRMNHHVFFAAGCGITPIISMVETILKKEHFSKISLFYSNKSWESTIFRKRLKAIWDAFPHRFQFQMIFTEAAIPEATIGRLDQAKIGKLLNGYLKNHRKGKYYLCGPSGFMEDIMQALQTLDVPQSNIRYESFSGISLGPASEAVIPAVNAQVEVELDGKRHVITVGEKQTILDSALMAGLDANYSCRAGNCSSCKAKVVSGEVGMRSSKGLTAQEIAEGYILTCQAQPACDGVKIVYEA